MVTTRRPRAPEGLKDGGLRLWRAVVKDYELSAAELETLRQCCRTVDVLARIDAVLAAEDMVAEGSMGQARAHPLLATASDHRRLLGELLRDLCLPMPDETTGHRRSPAQVAAAQARWRAQRG
jgi:hypothetical protein